MLGDLRSEVPSVEVVIFSALNTLWNLGIGKWKCEKGTTYEKRIGKRLTRSIWLTFFFSFPKLKLNISPILYPTSLAICGGGGRVVARALQGEEGEAAFVDTLACFF